MDAKHEIVEKLQSSNNILVTVSSNPSVDQLAACIGLTLLLNKLDKHATAVFSGEVPSIIEFLKPEETLEKNTDSLRDFIIALDKSKADKLRYKVEDKVVKIFITPYRTSLSGDDLNFSQGDFNIDIVVALGVHQQSDLDQAITSHGRILHDATVACINNTPSGELGTVNWSNSDASSLSELIVDLAKSFDKPLLDEQIATALLTGIVAETDRFRNEKTTATTMSLSADLMSAGANQKLVAEELEHPVDLHAEAGPDDAPQVADKPQDTAPKKPAPKSDDGTLEIDHPDHPDYQPPTDNEEKPADTPEEEKAEEQPEPKPAEKSPEPEQTKPAAQAEPFSRSMITEAPTLGGRLTANTTPEEAHLDPSIDPLGGTMGDRPLLSHDEGGARKAPDVQPPKPGVFEEEKAPDLPPPAAAPLNMPQPTPFTLPPTPPAPETTPPVPPAPAPTPQPKPEPKPAPAAELPKPQPAPELPQQAATPEPPKPASLTEREEPSTPPEDDIDAVEKARQEVLKAINEQADTNLPPVQALNAQPVDLGPKPSEPAVPPVSGGGQLTPPNPPAPQTPAPLPPNAPDTAPFANSPPDQPLTMPMPPGINLPPPQTTPPTNAPDNPNPAPPVPPPLMPPNWPPQP